MSQYLRRNIVLFIIQILSNICFNEEINSYKRRAEYLFKSLDSCKLEENRCLLPGSINNLAECIKVEFPIKKNESGYCEIEDDYCFILSIKKTRQLRISTKSQNEENSDLVRYRNFYCSCKPSKSKSTNDKLKRCFYEDIDSCYDYAEGETINNLSMKKLCGIHKDTNPNCVNIDYENFVKTYDFRLTYFSDISKEEYYKFSPIGNSIFIPDENVNLKNIDICHCPEYFMCYESISRNKCSPTIYEKIKPRDKKSNLEYEFIMHFPNRDGLYCLNQCKEGFCYDDFNTHTCIPTNNEIIPSADTHGFCSCIDKTKCLDHESLNCIQPRDFMDAPSRLCQCMAMDHCYRHDNFECVVFDVESVKNDMVKCICPDEKPCIKYPQISEFGDPNKAIFHKFDSKVKCSKVKKGYKAVGNNRDCIPIIEVSEEDLKTDL